MSAAKPTNPAREGKPLRASAPVFLSALLLAACSGFAQAPAPAQSQPQTAAHPHPAHKQAKKSFQKALAPTPTAEVHPPDPPPPNWPVLAQPHPAEVHFNGTNLSVDAANSSLKEILEAITTATGMKVDGFATDQRVFGSFGPASPRDVLAKLLEGTGYDVLMIGDRGAGTPRELVLTSNAGQPATASQPAQTQPPDSGDDDVVVEEPEQPADNPAQQQPHPFPGGSGRTPQQMMQEMQMRQQQIQQQQQQPPPQPPSE